MNINSSLSLLLIASTVLSRPATAQNIRPRIDILGSYVFPQYQTKITSGAFSLEHKNVRPCVEIGADIPILERFFAGIGVRYHHYFTSIYANNITPDIINNAYPFSWERGFTALTVPVSIGMPILTEGNRIIELRAGAALGLLTTGYAMTRATIDNRFASVAGDTLEAGFYVPAKDNPTYFFATLDFAATIYPFRRIHRLGITLQSSFELTHNNSVSHTAWIENVSKSQTFSYAIEHKTRFQTVSLGLHYQFGKQPENRIRNRMACPDK